MSMRLLLIKSTFTPEAPTGGELSEIPAFSIFQRVRGTSMLPVLDLTTCVLRILSRICFVTFPFRTWLGMGGGGGDAG